MATIIDELVIALKINSAGVPAQARAAIQAVNALQQQATRAGRGAAQQPIATLNQFLGQYNRQLGGVQRSLTNIGATSRRTGQAVRSGGQTAAQGIASLATAATTAYAALKTVQTTLDTIGQSSADAARTARTAWASGVSPQWLSSVSKYLLRTTNVPQETTEGLIQSLTARIEEFKQGRGDAGVATELARYAGVADVRTISTPDLLQRLADVVGKEGVNGPTAQFLANTLQLGPLAPGLARGGQAWKQGIGAESTLDPEQFRRLVELQGAINGVSIAWRNLTETITAAVGPLLSEHLKMLEKWIEDNKAIVAGHVEGAVSELTTSLKGVDWKEVGKDIAFVAQGFSLLGTALRGLREGVQVLREYLGLEEHRRNMAQIPEAQMDRLKKPGLWGWIQRQTGIQGPHLPGGEQDPNPGYYTPRELLNKSRPGQAPIPPSGAVRPSPGASGPTAAASVSGGLSEEAYNAIARAEGTMGASGINYGALAGGGKADLENMTIAQALEEAGKLPPGHQDIGGFQANAGTIRDFLARGKSGVDPNTAKFDRAMQKRIADWTFMQQGSGAWHAFEGNPAELQKFQDALGSGVTGPATGAAARLNAFAEGNARLGGPSSVGGLHEEFASRIEKMVADMPPDIRSKFKIYSGFRDSGRQAQVHPSVTNSHHTGAGFAGTGMAADVIEDQAVLNWILHNGPRHGVGLPLANDPKEFHHMEPMENGQRVAPQDMAEWARTHARVANMLPQAGNTAAATARNIASQAQVVRNAAGPGGTATSNDNSITNDVNVGDVHVHGAGTQDGYALGGAISSQIKRDMHMSRDNTGLRG